MKLLLKVVLLHLLLYSSVPSNAQKNDFEVGLYNLGINGVIGGIGAAINKKKGEPLGKVILKGVGQGALGGYFIFESKRLVREFSETENFAYVWPSKLVNSAGISIVENAAANRDFWEKWHLTIGFNRIELNTTENFKVSYRIMPVALVGTIISSTRGELDLEKTLKVGTFVFTADELKSERGISYGRTSMIDNSILLLDTWEGDIVLAHEIIHTYQNENFAAFNSYLEKPLNSLSAKEEFFKGYSKYFYSDISPLMSYLMYNAAGTGENKYENNIFEREAFYFTTKIFENPKPPVLF